MTWQEWLKANYNPNKPITVQLPRFDSAKARAQRAELMKLIKGENKMSGLTQEAILAELAKLSDSKGRAISFHDGQTIVPNSLLEQVWLEAERNTTKRIIKLLEEASIGFEQFDFDAVATTNFLIRLIQGETNETT